MSSGIYTGLAVVIVLLYIDAVLICRLIIKRLKRMDEREDSLEQKEALLQAIGQKELKDGKNVSIEGYNEIKQSIDLRQGDKKRIEKNIDIKKIEKRYIKRLGSIFKSARMEAAVYLGVAGTDSARKAIGKALLKEKGYTVKLYMANALADMSAEKSIHVLVASLLGSHRWYREKVNMMVTGFGEGFSSYLLQIINSDEIEIKELIVDFASGHISSELKSYLVNLIDTREEALDKLNAAFGEGRENYCANCIYGRTEADNGDRICTFKGNVKPKYKCRKYKRLPVSYNIGSNYMSLIYKAAEAVAKYYPRELDNEKYLKSSDENLRKIAVKALSGFNSIENVKKLIALLDDDVTARTAVHSISRIIERDPGYINIIAAVFKEEEKPEIRKRLADVLSGRIEYFIMKLNAKDSRQAAEVIKEILSIGKTSEIIDFLNKNKDIDLENELIAIIKQVLTISHELKDKLSAYLSDRLLNKFGIAKQIMPAGRKEAKKDYKLIRTLYLVIAAAVLFFPLVYLVRRSDILFNKPIMEQLEIYVVDFNYYLAYYSIAINTIYLLLLAFSVICVYRQSRRWKLKSVSMLFKRKMLPSISIIAPAYNEEKTIIESANSLLNLKYPDYELIIVNDGSKDRTLDVLIRYFDLVRIDYMFEYKLNTAAVRGIYVNRSLPKLIVVDKQNGGKADSLNAGINISSKEYFCGIDADSLLESDALLKLASLTIDEEVEAPALGGNIFPINGCKVETGHITDVNIPKNRLARFQTIEYIRSFMAGRLGWAQINGLLIISGAFGLFRKERVISVGGYLTSKGRYRKDTVGEDMELVVRISRLMRELGLKARICYAFNANCWTEVPEDLKSLKKQRYRWHKGLIDILTFHRKMILNPAYGRVGMMSMPYFFIFEMLGPLIEIHGYIMVIVAFILGILNMELALLLFIATVLYGVLISIASLLIAEKDLNHFKFKDIFILILHAIIENLGPRQLFSFWRVSGFFNVLKSGEEWGQPQRKGFAPANANLKG